MKLDKNKTYIALFTRGRINKQKTLRYFTPEMVKSTIVVTADSEKKELQAALKAEGFDVLKVISFPDDHRLSIKRFKTAKYLQKHGCKYFFMCDDDASLSVLIDGKYRTTRTDEGQAALAKVWRTIPKLWSDYTTLGISASSRNNRNFFTDQHTHKKTGLYVQESTKNALFFGARVDWFVNHFSHLSKHNLFNDVAYIDAMNDLIGVQNGRTGRIYNIAWATTFDDKKSSGGMNLYRSKVTNQIAILMLKVLFPGTIVLRNDEKNFYETWKFNRHAWKPVEQWNPAKIDWALWHQQASQQLDAVMRAAPDFRTRKAAAYAKARIADMYALANGSAPILSVPDSLEDARYKNLRGQRAIDLALQTSRRGKPVCVVRTGRGAEAKSVERQINVNIIRNWRT